MNPDTTALAIELAKSVATSAAKSASGAIWHKVQLAKQKKDLAEARQAYEEIINELSQDNTNLVAAAQAYKAQLDQVEISDKDIQSLHSTVDEVLEILKSFSVMDGASLKSFEQLKKMLTANTLRTLQLLGFNYHDAIGEPLTDICRNAILKWGGMQSGNKSKGRSAR
jgi:prefoldin subunit 5